MKVQAGMRLQYSYVCAFSAVMDMVFSLCVCVCVGAFRFAHVCVEYGEKCVSYLQCAYYNPVCIYRMCKGMCRPETGTEMESDACGFMRIYAAADWVERGEWSNAF